MKDENVQTILVRIEKRLKRIENFLVCNFTEYREDDEILEDVKKYAKEGNEISASLIQRRFKVGYARGARILNQLKKEK
ncbi:MAG: DNA translocase FtsK [Pedobacter sp.]|jgi:DNA segregation ATPase FtsK/SpoIIIE-like protein